MRRVKKNIEDYTAEEIMQMEYENEHFRGTRANLEKIRLYNKVMKELKDLAAVCYDIKDVNGFAPDPRERHAIMWADLSIVSMWEKDDLADLLHILSQADEIIIARGEDRVRLSMTIRDVWDG